MDNIKITHELVKKLNSMQSIKFETIDNVEAFLDKARTIGAYIEIDKTYDCYVIYINKKCIVCSNRGFELDNSQINAKSTKIFNEVEAVGVFQNSLFTSIDLSNVNTSHVKNMANLFCGAFANRINMSNVDTRNVTDMSGMFEHTVIEDLNIKTLDVSNVKYMNSMFKGATIGCLTMPICETPMLEWTTSMFEDFKSNNKVDISSLKTKNAIKYTELDQKIRELHMFCRCNAEFIH